MTVPLAEKSKSKVRFSYLYMTRLFCGFGIDPQ